MADLLQQGIAWLEAQRSKHLSQTVLYKRGVDSVSIAATIGRTEFEQTDELGVVSRTESRDFLVLAADLVLASAVVLPQAGDTIEETVGSQTFTYEVNAPAGEQPWRDSDPYRTTLRIHTKHVGTT